MEKRLDQRIAAEPAIELPEVIKITLKLGGDRLRSVHQFERVWVKTTIH